MDFNFDTGSIFGGIQTIDPTILPPLGGQVGVLTIQATGAITLPKGTTVQEPAIPVTGMFRYNTDINQLEYYDSTVWQQLTSTAGTVSSFQTSLAGLTPTTATTGAITLAGTLGATSGGTGSSTAPTAGQFLYSAAGTTYAPTTLTSTVVTSFSAGTTGFTPNTGTTGAVTLAGILSLASGGTNANLTAVAGAPVYSTGSAFALGTAGTTGQAYISGGTGVPTWQTISSTLTTNQILEGNGSGAFTANGGTFVGSGSFSGVTLSGTVTNGTDATTKDYVDAQSNGLSWKQAVIAGSTANIDLTTGGLLTIDGVTLTDGERVLVKNQTSLPENGIYIAHAGTWIRSLDMDSTTPINEVNGAAVFIEQGTTQSNTAWVQIDNVVTIGTDPIQFTQFAGPGSYTAGNGLQLIGNQFSLIAPVTVANGGTGLTTAPTNGQLLIGNGTGYTLAGLTAGTGISVVNGAGTITVTNIGVTSLLGTANQITVSANTGAVTLSIPSTFIAPGSVEVTTTLAVDVSEVINPNKTSGNIGVGLTIFGNTADDLQDWILNDGTTVAAKVDPTGNLYLYEGLGDSTNSLGTLGQILTSTGSTVAWMNPAATGVTSFSAGTTGFTPNTATTGAVTLAGTLNTGHGGTGLTTIGTSNQVLGVNNAGTALEYKTIAAGTGISVVHGANVVTINNTGVLSFSLNDTSTTPIYTTTPTSATTGVIASTITLSNQSANLVFAGPTSGGAAQPTFRGLIFNDLTGALQLYRENPSTPVTPVASGLNAVAIGSGSTASGDGSFAEGDGAKAALFGGKAFANGSFAASGDAQHGVYVLRNETTDATPTDLFLDGTAATQLLVIPDNSVVTFDILIAARRTDAVGGGAAYRFVGVARKDATSGSITFIGTPSKTILGETNTPWDTTLTVDTGNGAIVVTVIGEAAKTVRWVATVQTTEVTN